MALKVENLVPYTQDKRKTEQIEEMFNTIAPAYERFNFIASFGADRYWRKQLLNEIGNATDKKILDVACGTGDVCRAISKKYTCEIDGLDLAENMLFEARKKLSNNITYIHHDFLTYKFTKPYDVITIAFGIRNFESINKGLIKSYELLNTGGKLIILEFSPPPKGIFGKVYKLYNQTIVPFLGKHIAKSKISYNYLANSINAFPNEIEIRNMMTKVGFSDINIRGLTFGVVKIYSCIK